MLYTLSDSLKFSEFGNSKSDQMQHFGTNLNLQKNYKNVTRTTKCCNDNDTRRFHNYEANKKNCGTVQIARHIAATSNLVKKPQPRIKELVLGTQKKLGGSIE